jgi:hypothetical protein
VSLSLRYGDGRRAFALRGAPVGGELALDACKAIWWRRPQTPAVSPLIGSASHRMFATNEIHEALTGLWYATEAFWINDPVRDQVAHRKVYQLRIAQEVGLPVPDTLITSDPQDAHRFIDGQADRPVVFKSFSALPEEWRETRLLGQEELGLPGVHRGRL